MKSAPEDLHLPLPRQIDPEIPPPGAGPTPPRIGPIPVNVKKPAPPAKPKEDPK